VGRSHECDFPEEVKSLPVCTAPGFAVEGSSRDIDRRVKDSLSEAVSVYEVDSASLERLGPTHLLTQSQCEVCAVSLSDVERALSRQVTTRPKVVSLTPNSLSDIWTDIQRVADALEAGDRGREAVRKLQSRLSAIVERIPRAEPRPSVACIEWLEPLMAGGNWVPELVEMAGGVNLFGKQGEHSPWMSWDELRQKDPDVIVVMPCGFDLDRTEKEMYWLTQRAEWLKLRAVKAGRVYVTDGNRYFNRPGPRVVETLQILAEILYPAVFEPHLRGVGWKVYRPFEGPRQS
jgi:iron complex transport system substrate-binding protein